MIERLIEYRESQQYRKDRLTKEKMRLAWKLFVVCLAVLMVAAAIESAQPDKPAKAAAVPTAKQLEIQKIDKFVNVVTMPIDQLSDEDLTLLDSVSKDPCYEQNVQVEQALMADEIKKCKGL